MYDLTKDRRKFDRRIDSRKATPSKELPRVYQNRRQHERRTDTRPLSQFPHLPFCEL